MPAPQPHIWDVPPWLEDWFKYTIGEWPTGDEAALWTAGQKMIDKGQELQRLASDAWIAANRAYEGMVGTQAGALFIADAQRLRDGLTNQGQALVAAGEFVFDYAAKVQETKLIFFATLSYVGYAVWQMIVLAVATGGASLGGIAPLLEGATWSLRQVMRTAALDILKGAALGSLILGGGDFAIQGLQLSANLRKHWDVQSLAGSFATGAVFGATFEFLKNLLNFAPQAFTRGPILGPGFNLVGKDLSVEIAGKLPAKFGIGGVAGLTGGIAGREVADPSGTIDLLQAFLSGGFIGALLPGRSFTRDEAAQVKEKLQALRPDLAGRLDFDQLTSAPAEFFRNLTGTLPSVGRGTVTTDPVLGGGDTAGNPLASWTPRPGDTGTADHRGISGDQAHAAAPGQSTAASELAMPGRGTPTADLRAATPTDATSDAGIGMAVESARTTSPPDAVTLPGDRPATAADLPGQSSERAGPMHADDPGHPLAVEPTADAGRPAEPIQTGSGSTDPPAARSRAVDESTSAPGHRPDTAKPQTVSAALNELHGKRVEGTGGNPDDAALRRTIADVHRAVQRTNPGVDSTASLRVLLQLAHAHRNGIEPSVPALAESYDISQDLISQWRADLPAALDRATNAPAPTQAVGTPDGSPDPDPQGWWHRAARLVSTAPAADSQVGSVGMSRFEHYEIRHPEGPRVSGIQFVDPATRTASARWWESNTFEPHAHGYHFTTIGGQIHPVVAGEFPWTRGDSPAPVFLVLAPGSSRGAFVKVQPGAEGWLEQVIAGRPPEPVLVNGGHLAQLVRDSATFRKAWAEHGASLNIVLVVPGFGTDANPNHARMFADNLGYPGARVWASRYTVRLNRRGDLGADAEDGLVPGITEAWQEFVT